MAAEVTVSQVMNLGEYERRRLLLALEFLEGRRKLAAEELDTIDMLIRKLRGQGPVGGSAGGNGHEPDAEKRRELLAGDRETGAAATPERAAKPTRRQPSGKRGPTLSPNNVLEVLKRADRPMTVSELHHELVAAGLAPSGVRGQKLRTRLHKCLSTHSGELWQNLGRSTGWEAMPNA